LRYHGQPLLSAVGRLVLLLGDVISELGDALAADESRSGIS
jgi:hypothetical protein